MIASTFSIVVAPLLPPAQPCPALHPAWLPDVLFNALPTAAVTATTRTISLDSRCNGQCVWGGGRGSSRGWGMEIAQETYNLFQFISFCHHSLLLWRRQHTVLCAPRPQLMLMLPTFDFGMSRRSRFAIVRAPCVVSMSRAPCAPLCRPVPLYVALYWSLALCACACRPVPLPGTLCLSPVPSMSISIDSLSLGSRLPWLPFGGRRPRHNLSSAKKNRQ